MRIEQADHRDVSGVMQVVSLCIRQMRAHGIHQWDEVYPDPRSVEEDARAGSLFVIRQGESCVASVSLDDNQPEEYRCVRWCVEERALVVHRLCVHPDWQGHGLGTRLMDFAENFAIDQGFPSVRLDAYTGNPHALALYEGRGYRRAGQLFFPRRELPFACFEKVLSERKMP